MIVSRNPATGLEFKRFEIHTSEEIDVALTRAMAAQANWRKRPLGKRVELLANLADRLRAGKSAYAEIITAEMGKPLKEAREEIDKCAWNCEFYAESAAKFLEDELVASSASESSIIFDPLGVVLAIMPWNYPFWQLFRFVAPAMTAGNGVILKHANNVPQCALAIEDLMRQAGCPEGLFRSLLLKSDQVSRVIADDRIAAVTFTGSTQIGSIVAAEAAKSLKKQVLELGGSDPFVVLSDADVEAAAAAAVKARFINVGQSCVNAKRFIVDEAVADYFVDTFCSGVDRLQVGDPMQVDTTIGPLARADLRSTLHDQVQRSVEAGAVPRRGGHFIPGDGFFYAPTVLDAVRPGMAAFEEETFGPVAAIIRVKDTDEAIRLANATEFGLGAALWTSNVARARILARELQAGAVFINGIVSSDPRLPFGGIKKSGYGRELGVYGIREFVNVKTCWIGPARPASESRTSASAQKAHSVAGVVRRSDVTPHERGGGARTTPLVTRKMGATNLINGITAFDGGAEIPLHKHNCEESVLILEGAALAIIDGTEHRLGAGDATWIPPDVPHYFKNASPTEPMQIFWTYGSAQATRTIVATGETRAISAEPSPKHT